MTAAPAGALAESMMVPDTGCALPSELQGIPAALDAAIHRARGQGSCLLEGAVGKAHFTLRKIRQHNAEREALFVKTMNLLNVGCPAILCGIRAFVEFDQLRK